MKEDFQVFLKGIEKEFCMLGLDIDAIKAYVCRVTNESGIDLQELLCGIENSYNDNSKFIRYFYTTANLCGLCEAKWDALKFEMNYSELALQKYPPALYMIGLFYLLGVNSDKDLSRALMYFRFAGDRGFAPAKTQVANLIFRGSRKYSIPADRSYAELLYHQTMLAGDPRAAYYYAFSLLDVYHVPAHDKQKAMVLLNEAAAKGVQAAIRLLKIDAMTNKLRQESTPSPMFEMEL